MIFEAPDADVLDAYTSDPTVQETMKKGGVMSVPVATVLQKV